MPPSDRFLGSLKKIGFLLSQESSGPVVAPRSMKITRTLILSHQGRGLSTFPPLVGGMKGRGYFRINNEFQYLIAKVIIFVGDGR